MIKRLIGIAALFIVTPVKGQTFEEYYSFLVTFEGKRSLPYKDSLGKLTVGVGHLMKATDKVRHYSEAEIQKMFAADLENAKQIATSMFPNFRTLHKQVKLILVSLSFNLGKSGLGKFKKFVTSINDNNFKAASSHLRDSLWFRQTGKRAKHHVGVLAQI
jgi:lysozyme